VRGAALPARRRECGGRKRRGACRAKVRETTESPLHQPFANDATDPLSAMCLALCGSLRAELPMISDDDGWLGYFAGWENRKWAYGFSDAGGAALFAKSGKERNQFGVIKMFLRLEQNAGEKWKAHNGTWNSEAKPVVNSKKPVDVTVELKDGTKLEVAQVIQGGKMILKPKSIEGAGKAKQRVALTFRMMPLNRNLIGKSGLPEKELKKQLKGSWLKARRAKDRKNISYEFYEKKELLLGDKMLADGASKIDFRMQNLGKVLTLEQGDPDLGHFEIHPFPDGRPLYLGVEIVWYLPAKNIGKRDAYLKKAPLGCLFL